MPHLYQEIAESIRQQIATGTLQPGDRLPSVRDSARQWQCTPGTVNRAYRQLADEGLIGGHRGGGTRVTANSLAEHPPQLRWAGLVNRAEQYLLECLSSGHTLNECQAALSIAISRWQTLRDDTPAENEKSRKRSPLRFAGSHDLAVELLIQRLEEETPHGAPVTSYVGSLGGLMAMARGEADIAGVHLWDAATSTYNKPFVNRILPGKRLALVTLTHRAQGLMVPPGNPQRLRQLADLTADGVRWINRQSGSGTRVWLDEQLRQLNINPQQIQGYERETTTHLGVAQAIKDGQATAGLGIQAAADGYGLGFIPLAEEVYQLVVPDRLWESKPWISILDVINSKSFLAAVTQLGGYNTATAGQVVWV